METRVPVNFADFLDAFDWVSATADSENSTYHCRSTVATLFASSSIDIDDDLPGDIDDGNLYVPVPNKIEFNLGKNFATKFAVEHRPNSYDEVCRFFRKSGA